MTFLSSPFVGIYEVYAGNKHFHYGKQPELFLNTDTVGRRTNALSPCLQSSPV